LSPIKHKDSYNRLPSTIPEVHEEVAKMQQRLTLLENKLASSEERILGKASQQVAESLGFDRYDKKIQQMEQNWQTASSRI
jgi:uncharacterized coiled-coil protein SlyX